MSRFTCPRKSSLRWTSSGSNSVSTNQTTAERQCCCEACKVFGRCSHFILVCHQMVAVVVSFHQQPGRLPVLLPLHDRGGQEHVEEEERSQIAVQPEWVLWYVYIGQRGVQCVCLFLFMYFLCFVSVFPCSFPYVVIIQCVPYFLFSPHLVFWPHSFFLPKLCFFSPHPVRSQVSLKRFEFLSKFSGLHTHQIVSYMLDLCQS